MDLDSCVKGVDGAPRRSPRSAASRELRCACCASSTAARAPGSMTPMIGTSNERCVALRAEAVAVLHAITISFTFMPMR